MYTPFEVELRQLGIEGDDMKFSGDAPGEVVDQIVTYLRTEYNISLPDAATILGEGTTTGIAVATPTNAAGVETVGVMGDPVSNLDPDASVIVRRLREALDLPREEN
jgi:hypothetical protein